MPRATVISSTLFTKSGSATIQGVNTSMPPVTPIGFTGMIRDPTRTTVSGKIARSFGGGEVIGNRINLSRNGRVTLNQVPSGRPRQDGSGMTRQCPVLSPAL